MILAVRELLRKNLRFFLWSAIAGLALRLLFIVRFPAVTSDSFIYGDIAKNWLQHGIYGISSNSGITPTYTRLPGYPMFLAGVFTVFGVEHYRAVLFLQLLVDLATCFVIADLARRLVSDRAAKMAFVFAALCPFLANYAAAALTETLEIFFTTLALDFAVAGFSTKNIRPWVGCGLAVAYAILLRPDGVLLLAAIGGYLLVRLVACFKNASLATPLHLFRAGVTLSVLALAPLVPWALRNLRTLHRLQPLAPRYATDPGEFVPMGFNRWVKTWITDYASTEEIYWAVPDNQMQAGQLPARAFDSAEQQEQTEELIDDYNNMLRMTPELDARFAALANQRIHDTPLRYYLWLPFVRIADMWLRPRTEILPSDSRWWEFDDDPKWSALAVVVGVINLLYIGAALGGLARLRCMPYLCLLLAFVILRSAFLGSLENPETRYTLECYPVVILLAAGLFRKKSESTLPSTA